MGKGQQKTGRCTYCGEIGPVTADHVPPRNIFLRPLPPNLITVPACEKCREGTGLDDEYFRNQLTFRADVSARADADQAFQRVVRALDRPEQERFRKALMDSIDLVRVRSPMGIDLGRRAVYSVDLERIERVVARTVRGLYRHHCEQILPRDAVVEVWSEDAFKSPDVRTLNALDRILAPVMQNPEHVLGERTFVYRYALAEGIGYASAWLMRVYEDTRFLGVTLPRTVESRIAGSG